MSTGFRTRVLPTPRSVLATLQVGWRPPPLAIVRERLFLKAGRKTFGYPRHAPFGNGERRSRSNNSALRTFVPGFINGCSDFPSGNWALVASNSRVSHGRRQTPQNMERGGLFQHLILERHAFRIVLLEPLLRGVHTCEYLDVLSLLDLLAHVAVNGHGYSSLVSFR